MRRLAILATITGVIGFTILVERIGVGAIAGAMRTLGWTGFAAIVAFHLAVIALVGVAWWLLARDRGDGRLRCFVWGRLIRDSAGETLPFSQVGGFVMGARAASLCGVPGRFAAASTIVDMTIEVAARVPYMLLGLGLIARLGARVMPQWMAGGGVLDTIRAIHARRAALLRAFLVHCLGWVLSGV